MPDAETNADQTAHMLNVTREHLYAMARRGTIPYPVNGRWDVLKCVRLYIGFLREGSSASVKTDKARKIRAEANIAEKKDAELDDILCEKQQALEDFADVQERWLAVIAQREDLTSEQKEEIVADLRAIRLPDLAFEDEDEFDRVEETGEIQAAAA